MTDDERIAAMPTWLANCLPGPGTFIERLTGPFPWVSDLPADEVVMFADDLVSASTTPSSAEGVDAVDMTIRAWEATATAYADGLSGDAELNWLEDFVPVERPAPAPA